VKQVIVALLAGVIFGVGLAVSQMINPAKVLAFLDLAGGWDPSLLVVMAGAVSVTFVGFRLARRRVAPLLAQRFELPTRHDLDRSLVAGAVLFGIGWGLTGFCPGPAFASLGFGLEGSVVFVAAMVLGAWLQGTAGRWKAMPAKPLPR
jgi:uncharacterized membrane protein YedE/YeeE